ncbi:MAG TPA: DUF5808 domain-containing protein [Gemmatimonadaceae bacterium]
MAARALKYMLAGALIGGVAGWFIFGGTAYNATTGNYGWGPIMAPTFALTGAIVGLLTVVLVSAWRGFNAKVNASAEKERVGPYSGEWDSPANWTGRIFYKSRVDRRVFVPKKLPGGGFTINLGQPLGIALAIVLFVVLAVTLFSLITHW